MMNEGMGSMMSWMMGLGFAGWILVIALLVTIVVLLVQILRRSGGDGQGGSRPSERGSGEMRG